MTDLLEKYGPLLLAVVPFVGFWLYGRKRDQAPARGRIRAAQRKAAGERARVDAATASAAATARADAARDAAGDDAAVVDALNERRGRK